MWPFPKREPRPQPTYILSGNQYVMRPDLAAKYFPPAIATKPPRPPRPAGRGSYPAGSKPMSEAKPPPTSISKPSPSKKEEMMKAFEWFDNTMPVDGPDLQRLWLEEHPGYAIKTPPGFFALSTVPMCLRCGATVLDTDLHDQKCAVDQ